LRNQGSEAVSIAVEEAKVYVQSQRIVGADETGFKQGNADGKNPEKKRLGYGWL
jgi:transposase